MFDGVKGNVAAVMDESGSVVARYEYDAWGNPLRTDDPGAGNRFTYQDNWIRLKDSGGELYLSPSRLYHAQVGRFLQSDPLPKVQNRGEPGIYENSIFAAEVFDGLLAQLDDFPDGAAPLACAAGVTRPYAYAGNNPTGLVDPSGFFPWLACGKNVAAGIKDTMVESLTGLPNLLWQLGTDPINTAKGIFQSFRKLAGALASGDLRAALGMQAPDLYAVLFTREGLA